jgi:hypothetical protein
MDTCDRQGQWPGWQTGQLLLLALPLVVGGHGVGDRGGDRALLLSRQAIDHLVVGID